MHDQKIAVFLWYLLLRDRGCVYMEYMMICTYLQQALKEYLIWSLILNSYFTKPLKSGSEKKVRCDNSDYIYEVMYLSLGHDYELKSSYNLIFTYVCLYWDNAYDK
jgi:hypothetical protein